jgi:hypothetical protein
MSDEDRCCFCGEIHYLGPTDRLIFTCPMIPEGCFYMDVKFETGPRGVLVVANERDVL